MQFDILVEQFVSVLKELLQVLVHMVFDASREKTVSRKNILYLIPQHCALRRVAEIMTVAPAGKRPLFLDVPEHFSGYMVSMAGPKLISKGTGVHYKFHRAARFYPTLSGNNRNLLPWRQ
jgi:hypothetical protein